MHKILVLVSCAFLLLIIHLLATYFIFPNTYLARINISGKKKSDLTILFEKYRKSPITIQVKDRSYPMSYMSIGVLLDNQKTYNSIYEYNNASFPQKYLSFFSSLFSQRMLLPTMIFSQNYYQFTQNSLFDFSSKKDETYIDNNAKEFKYIENEEVYRIDPENLRTLLVFHFGEDNLVLTPKLIKISNEKKDKISVLNEKIARMYTSPVQIILQGDVPYTIRLDPEQIKTITTLTTNREESLSFTIDEPALSKLVVDPLNSAISNQDKKISSGEMKDKLSSLLSSRIQGASPDTIVSEATEHSNTEGKRTREKYIEIDISQQRMYLFENNTQVATYRISSGLYYPTPVGQFKIINKANNAYSDIYHVWMPFWMAFYYDSKLNAYFGIHELPYWVTSNGTKIQRPREFIGSPHTGGCVALDLGMAKEVYTFAEVGMSVYVFN
ncbi:MAG: L,D-transpeptidase [bacterium]|nr:L,D-transpeptidase [bacterium]